MPRSRIALLLALLAGALCLSKFALTYFQTGTLDYFILLAGVFVLAFGVGNGLRKRP